MQQVVSAPIENTHDWEFIFSELGVIEQDLIFGGSMKLLGLFFGVFGLGMGAYMVFCMFSANDQEVQNSVNNSNHPKSAKSKARHKPKSKLVEKNR